MGTYGWRLARPAWPAGASATVLAVAALAAVLDWADDVPGTLAVGRRTGLVVAAVAAAALRDPAAGVLDATPYPRRVRRLLPSACALLALAPAALVPALVQAGRVPGVPWSGLALEVAAMAALACAAGVWCTGRVDPGLVGWVAPMLLLLVDETTPMGPWLTAAPGPRWAEGRVGWAVAGAAGVVVLLAGLRDPAARRALLSPYR
ncbi:hypothetical protein [Actinoplanes sp. URMC 104]|uniref:hypothetical protein n=1 Tax=Actinoplanes sp. URMC 104 TaxID=3423409 RepID=UPI003F1B109E